MPQLGPITGLPGLANPASENVPFNPWAGLAQAAGKIKSAEDKRKEDAQKRAEAQLPILMQMAKAQPDNPQVQNALKAAIKTLGLPVPMTQATPGTSGASQPNTASQGPAAAPQSQSRQGVPAPGGGAPTMGNAMPSPTGPSAAPQVNMPNMQTVATPPANLQPQFGLPTVAKEPTASRIDVNALSGGGTLDSLPATVQQMFFDGGREQRQAILKAYNITGVPDDMLDLPPNIPIAQRDTLATGIMGRLSAVGTGKGSWEAYAGIVNATRDDVLSQIGFTNKGDLLFKSGALPKIGAEAQAEIQDRLAKRELTQVQADALIKKLPQVMANLRATGDVLGAKAKLFGEQAAGTDPRFLEMVKRDNANIAKGQAEIQNKSDTLKLGMQKLQSGLTARTVSEARSQMVALNNAAQQLRTTQNGLQHTIQAYAAAGVDPPEELTQQNELLTSQIAQAEADASNARQMLDKVNINGVLGHSGAPSTSKFQSATPSGSGAGATPAAPAAAAPPANDPTKYDKTATGPNGQKMGHLRGQPDNTGWVPMQ